MFFLNVLIIIMNIPDKFNINVFLIYIKLKYLNNYCNHYIQKLN